MDRRQLFRVGGHGATGVGSSRPTYIFSPESATFATAGSPQLKKQTGSATGQKWPDYTLDYSATTAEAAFWYVGIPSGADFNGGALEVFARFATAVSGSLGWTVTTRALGSGAAWGTVSGVVTTLVSAAIPTTACTVSRQSATLTVSGWSQAKLLQVKIARTTKATGAEVWADAKFMKALLRLTKDGR